MLKITKTCTSYNNNAIHWHWSTWVG